MTTQYKIYQLKSIAKTDYAFRDWDCAKIHGFNINDYKLVYSGETEEENVLEELWVKFNIDRPEDFCGHSLSVSDVVAIKIADIWWWYYCDDIGWVNITDIVYTDIIK